MAANSVSFADWRQATNESLMSTAETLLEKLEDVAEMLLEIDETFSKNKNSSSIPASETAITNNNNNNSSSSNTTNHSNDALCTAPPEVVQRFHEGVENAKSIIAVLKREKWRLNRREMSVEMRMGELEDYKSHLQSDMTSLNQTVEVLSMRVVQLENQLVEAQEVQEQLEAELAENKTSIEDYKTRLAESKKQNEKLKKSFEAIEAQTPHTLITENTMVKNEIAVLLDENKKLKELIRAADCETPPASDDHLNRLTRDFLRQLSSLDEEEEKEPIELDITVTPPQQRQQQQQHLEVHTSENTLAPQTQRTAAKTAAIT